MQEKINKEKFGERLRAMRLKNGLTGKELAKLSGVGTMHISEMERAQKLPSLQTYVNICNALNISSDDLLQDSIKVTSDYKAGIITEKIKRLSSKDSILVNAVLEAILNNI